MHNSSQSPSLTAIGEGVWWPCYIGSDIFGCTVSTAASQRLGVLRKPWRVFHDRLLLGRCFRGFVLPVLEYCSALWRSAADTHLKLLDRAVSGARFLTGVWLSVTLLIVDLWKYCVCCIRSGVIRCTHLINGALPGPYVPVQVTHSALVAHGYTYAMPRCGTLQTAGLLFPSQCHSGTIFLTPYSMVWDWRVSRTGPMLFYWPELLYPYYSLQLFFPFSSFFL